MDQPLTVIETMHLATLYTRILEDPDSKEIGNFTLEVRVSLAIFMASGDKVGMAKSAIAAHLASAVLDTQVPQEYWMCNVNPEYAGRLNLPAVMSFGG